MKQHEQMFPKTFVNAESPQYSDLPNQRVRPVCVCSSGYFGGEHTTGAWSWEWVGMRLHSQSASGLALGLHANILSYLSSDAYTGKHLTESVWEG